MLYILVKHDKEQVASDYLEKIISKDASNFNFAMLGYPNNVYLFYLYYGNEFVSEKGQTIPAVHPIQSLIPRI